MSARGEAAAMLAEELNTIVMNIIAKTVNSGSISFFMKLSPIIFVKGSGEYDIQMMRFRMEESLLNGCNLVSML